MCGSQISAATALFPWKERQRDQSFSRIAVLFGHNDVYLEYMLKVESPREPTGSWGVLFIETARKPRAFKLGDEWLPRAKPVKAGGAEVSFGIIWAWPNIGQGHTRGI